MDLNQRFPRLDPSRFSMVPNSEIPRSTFVNTHTHKTTFDCGYLIPIHVEEVLPGDSFAGRMTCFARLATPLFPIMDNMILESFFFFVPYRIVWDNFVKMMGERTSPSDSIAYTIPTITYGGGSSGPAIGSIHDYMGIPRLAAAGAAGFSVSVLPFRAYAMIWNEWFRDQNLQTPILFPTTDSGDPAYELKRRNKRPDYFTSALPWPEKGGAAVTLPMAGTAPVRGIARNGSAVTAGDPAGYQEYGGVTPSGWAAYQLASTASAFAIRVDANAATADPFMYADLSSATGASINLLRQAFMTQRLLEKDARGGTRYTEQMQTHFGVRNPDARLQRPEYIGGGRTNINTNAIPQTSATAITGSGTALGSLGAAATFADQHSFSYQATEHGVIIGLVHVTGEVTYQQGLHRMWTRRTRYDFYIPTFAYLGEQAIRNDELYLQGTTADSSTFGYQERWSEYRYYPSRVSGLFRSVAAGSMDAWHLAQEFGSLPTLNEAFIQDAPPVSRVLAAGASADGMQVLFDALFKIKKTRAMPMFSVPGNDRF